MNISENPIREFSNFYNVISSINFKPKIIFDIGARECNETLWFHKHYNNSTIFAFEPNPNQKNICENNIQGIPNIHFLPIALSDYEGTSDFYITNGNIGASSLLKPISIPWTPDQSYEKIQVPVTTLDKFCKTYNISNIDIIWIDAQGNELNILKGSIDTLKTTSILHTEAGIRPYYENHTLLFDIVSFMEKLNFKLINSFSDWDAEANLIFFNKSMFHIDK